MKVRLTKEHSFPLTLHQLINLSYEDWWCDDTDVVLWLFSKDNLPDNLYKLLGVCHSSEPLTQGQDSARSNSTIKKKKKKNKLVL